MIIWYSLIFIFTMAGGIFFASTHDFDLIEWVLTIGISGFIGSSAIALVFSFFFFFRRENEAEKVERLEAEIQKTKHSNQLKRLPR